MPAPVHFRCLPSWQLTIIHIQKYNSRTTQCWIVSHQKKLLKYCVALQPPVTWTLCCTATSRYLIMKTELFRHLAPSSNKVGAKQTPRRMLHLELCCTARWWSENSPKAQCLVSRLMICVYVCICIHAIMYTSLYSPFVCTYYVCMAMVCMYIIEWKK